MQDLNPGLSDAQIPGVLSAPVTVPSQLTSNQGAIVSHPCLQFTHTQSSSVPLSGQQNPSAEGSSSDSERPA